MVESIGARDKVSGFIERVKFDAKKDPLLGALGPFYGVHYEEMPPEKKPVPETSSGSESAREIDGTTL